MKNNPNYWNDTFSRKIDFKNTIELEFITKHFKKKDLLLEAGVGIGNISFKLSYLGYKLKGVDFSKDLIEFCKETSKKNNLGKPDDYILGNILNLPFKKEFFDGYLSFGVIEHFKNKNQKRIIKEAYRVLKKGGKVVVTVPNSYSPNIIQRYFISIYKKYIIKKPMVYQKNISTKTIKKMFEKEGFKTLECYNKGLDKAINRFFLVNYKLFGQKNPLFYLKRPIKYISKKMEKVFYKFGEDTVYVGIK